MRHLRLTAAQMPARDSDRHGTGYAGKFFIYDLDTIAEFLRHLLDNMYVQFGDQLLQQVIGLPWAQTVPPCWQTST